MNGKEFLTPLYIYTREKIYFIFLSQSADIWCTCRDQKTKVVHSSDCGFHSVFHYESFPMGFPSGFVYLLEFKHLFKQSGNKKV